MLEVRESILDRGDTTAEPLELPAAAASSDCRGLAMTSQTLSKIQHRQIAKLDNLSRSQCAKATAR